MATTANTENQSPPVHITGTPPQDLPGYTTVATFPPGSFLENLAVRRDGSILASDMLSGSIWYINPHAEDGHTQRTVELVHRFELHDAQTEGRLPGNVAEEEEAEEGHGIYSSTPAAEAIIESPTEPDLFYLFSGIHGKKGTWWVYELDMRSFIPSSNRTRTATTTSDEGEQAHQVAKVRRLAPVPTVTWLNGGTAIPHPTEPLILMAESYQGSLYSYNIKTGTVDVWLQHRLLGKMTTRPPWPGVNGVKYHHDGRDGWVYFTNSDRAILARVRVSGHQGDPAPVAARDARNGQVEIESLASGCGGDDLCLDGHGNIYVATNPHDTVLKFPRLASPDDATQAQRGKKGEPERQVILGLRRRQLSAEQASSPSKADSDFEVDGDTTGPTAVAFGTTASDKKDLYVVTNGGIINPFDGVVREARVLRVHL
ncbi:uncharacterized protein Z520_04851 [Fonsecaea multimorphosa CBS 102226]|uniref:SMP-30/Gluconolactonase/LRE-like region domain-containing protein n=1 Tax=Fonsecaea multimorphosa CBS 102226 TaxID=1442371 RepID=A0A0D2HBK4_9EURO|nr:uncharacterized protein Z520_04851 [Fonsecaea multimorphosa CBS 102226]KIX99275.1 hypothetical protein Z520_04851 [Fonsecaea multimorphosa CBS 102226]OAL25965.1 hypothetical protein AYO22_04592 [Fonsecaea multimorphosa]